MKKQTDITNELMQIAPAANWPADAPFTVPAGYFDQLPAAIITQIRLQEHRSENPVAHNNPFTTPSGYFDQLPQTILQRIKAMDVNPVQEELASLSPFMAAIPRQVPFSVPEGYFDALQATIPVPAAPLKVAYRSSVSRWMKWTVAACLTAFMGTSALLFLANTHNNNIERQLESLSDQDIVNYLSTHTDAFDNDAIFATAANAEAAPGEQSQLNEAVPLEAIEKYLQQTDLSKEVLPNK
ncbi:hypothetical protein CLV51_1011158 [Chitinophaga niastensis]|uniref:Uncharacterized protein n=1 Tax=Chitinophaga niastensis TaxID=536980 RepID=A0A2P8HUB9_CHINA|nr:hypothetical protein [Chitinophaga niastensis]PSL49821.1 hypothetical protein CLV51_1011158 [Chitinophaga niastensis]